MAVRLCLTQTDSLQGFEEQARFLFKGLSVALLFCQLKELSQMSPKMFLVFPSLSVLIGIFGNLNQLLLGAQLSEFSLQVLPPRQGLDRCGGDDR